MEINKLKEIVYSIQDLLNNESLPLNEELYIRAEKIFGPFTEKKSREEIWIKLHSQISRMYSYKEYEYKMRRGIKFRLIADKYCHLEQCPLNEVKINNSEPDFINLIVGPMGHIKEGEPVDFIKIILDRLSLTGTVSESYYFDPYIKEPFNGSFTENFLTELKKKLPPLIAITTKLIATNNSPLEIKKIPEDQIHDRFVIILEDSKWKGVSIGGSLNGFPNSSNDLIQNKKHFIITKLEDEDAQLLSEIIKNNI
ncbi:MAG: hypothetical protein HOP07_13195 [Bacteriovoracaceae bacterium]|nr:hypothetical protein [Bacteriovoracaceae bacterium]